MGAEHRRLTSTQETAQTSTWKGNPLKITVIGLGRLGTVAAAGLASAGHQVIGLDVDEQRVRALRKGRLPFYEPGLEECLISGVDRGNLRFIQNEEYAGCLGDIALITAGTPSTESGEVDMSQVRSALAWVRGRRPGNLVLVMKSTVPPGSGVEFVRNDLKGLNIDYIANPEFLREGRALRDWFQPDRIVLGVVSGSGKAVSAVREMYAGIESPFLVTDITSAEMIKYASNAFLATRISFINEMASLCNNVGASIDAVSDGLALDERTGARMHAGVGYGGSCLPMDIHAPQAPGKVRRTRNGPAEGRSFGKRSAAPAPPGPAELQVPRLPGRSANRRARTRLQARDRWTSGTAPSLELIRELVIRGASVSAFDPRAIAPARKLLPRNVYFAKSVEEAAVGAHALVLLTEWQEIVGADWDSMAVQMLPPRFLIDGRNTLQPRRMGRLGFKYAGIGRGDTNQQIILKRNDLKDSDDFEVWASGFAPNVQDSARHQPGRQSEFRYA